MSRPEDKGSELFGMNLFEHATKREQEEQECWWIITPAMQKGENFKEYRFFGTKEGAKNAAESMGEGKCRVEQIKEIDKEERKNKNND